MSYKKNMLLVDKTNKFLNTHNGRDKLCRTLQFGSKFVSLELEKRGETDYSKRLLGLSNNTSTARKVFRLFKSLSFIQNAINSYFDERDTILKVTTVSQNFCFAIWLYYDHFIWAGKVGLLKSDLTVVTKRSNLFWLAGLILAIIKQTYLLNQTFQLKKENFQVLTSNQVELSLELIRNIFDVPIPLTGLNEKAAQKISPSIVALLATFSSLIGFYQAWIKIK